ncbi:putative sodium-coupled neutral amino acid transporter 10 isoform X2 [Dermacentor albipictus]|uniref:putative sodium-coupled neutral amino acid transporter 10 isoform X2 n=1 Tax=Dermacentor albipictus TaxID=60249 RepID=UPI0031FD178F
MTASDMAWSSSLKNTINLGNSIIGVSILAMPYCFERCGIVLSSLLLLVSGLLTRMTCHLLLKSAITARRRNYEFLAFHTFGPTGKLVVEIGILGFLLGSCVAFFVVMGDLAPPLASDFFLLEASPRLRLTVLLLLGTCVGLPLGLLRNLDSLTSLSALSLGFYCLLVFKVFVESFPVLWSGAWWDRVVLWRHENLLSVLPIFAMALSCQPQLFEIFDTVNEPSLKRMNSVVNGAVQMCSMVYIMMGFFGYVAFCGSGGPLPGNVLVRLGSSLASEFIKLGFVATLVVSFPLCLFPCRTSLHSLLFKRANSSRTCLSPCAPEHENLLATVALGEQGSKFHDPSYDYIPDGQFRMLTVLLVGATLVTACLVPNIEIVLGLTGSTIGTLICVIMPALVFTRVQPKSTNERLVAKFLTWAGLCIMIGCTMTTLSQMRPPDRGSAPSHFNPVAVVVSKPAPLLPKDVKLANASPGPDLAKPLSPKADVVPPAAALSPKAVQPATVAEKRLEPPEPVEPSIHKEVVVPPLAKPAPVVERPPKDEAALDPEALKKEDREIAAATSGKVAVPPAAAASGGGHQPPGTAAPVVAGPEVKKQEALLEKIAQEQKVQKKMLEDLQRELKQELAKHKQDMPPQPQKTNGTVDTARLVAAPANVVAQSPVQDRLPMAAPAAPFTGARPEAPNAPHPAVAGSAPPLLNQGSQLRSKGPIQNIPQPILNQAPPLSVQDVQRSRQDSQQRQAQRVEQIVKVPLSVGVQPAAQNIHRVAANQQLSNPALPPPQGSKKDETGRSDLPDVKHIRQQPPALGPKVDIPPSLSQVPKQGPMHQPQLGIQNVVVQKQSVVPAADAIPKAEENLVKPLDIIMRHQDVQQPLQQKLPIVPESKPSLVQQQPKPILQQVPQELPAVASSFAKQPVHVGVEAPVKSLGKPLEVKDKAIPARQELDNRPLVRKMSKDVKREAPIDVDNFNIAEAASAAASKKAPVTVVPTALPLAASDKDVPAVEVKAAAISDVPVKVLSQDSISPSLPSRLQADVVLAKHEIRK